MKLVATTAGQFDGSWRFAFPGAADRLSAGDMNGHLLLWLGYTEDEARNLINDAIARFRGAAIATA